MTNIVPLGQLEHRLPEQGRIRLGVRKISKAGKEYPSKIPHFRFTSHDRTALEQLATIHGGTVKAWDKGPRAGEYDLLTTATVVRVALPPKPLSQHYELWSGGGCQRRCDGVTVEGGAVRQTPDGAEPVDVPCICKANDRLECKVTSRLTVVLRDVQFGGGWLLTTHSFVAAHTLPGMVELIQALQAGGLTTALLTLREYSDVKDGQTRKWMVPALAVPHTIDELASGEARLGALASGAQAERLAIDAPTVALPASVLDAESRVAGALDDADVADAELVDDGELVSDDDAARYYGETGDLKGADGGTRHLPDDDEAGPGNDASGPAKSSIERQRSLLHALINQCCDDGKKEGHTRGCAPGVDKDRFRHALIRTVTGADQSSNSLMPDEMSRVLDLLSLLVEGRATFSGIAEGFMRYTIPEEAF